MNKKTIISCVVVFLLAFGVGLFFGLKDRARQSALDFKNEYESVNGLPARGDNVYRSLAIDEKNPYVKTTIDEVVKKLNNKESFYLYVGDPLCPWCRSGLEKMIEVAIKEGIEDIYYIDFWDDDHNEILRDLYELQEVDGVLTPVKIQDATEGYNVLLDKVKLFAQDYTLTKDGQSYNVGVKRIMGGDHFYFANGICTKYTTLRSPKLANAFDELTPEVLEDQEKTFTEFFTKGNACSGDDNC